MAWTAFVFGGVYPATLAVPALVILALVLAYRPIILYDGPTAGLDFWLLVALGAAVLQTIPLPRGALSLITPNAQRVAAELALVDPGGALPISIALQDTAEAIALFGGILLVFFTARQVFEAGGVRTVTRGTAVVGLVLAAIALAQDATGGGLMYWRWRPLSERASPFGPFVNRNHFGTWAMMVIPLALGYLTAHAVAHQTPRLVTSWRRRLVAAMDARAALLLAAAACLIVAVAVSLSRSALLGLAAALLTGGWLSFNRSSQGGRTHAMPAAVGVLAVVAGALVIIRVPAAELVERVSAAPVGIVDRQVIWNATLPIIRDFWFAGTGVGTYQTAMAVYHPPESGVIFNQAHNHYLQVAAEGGLLVGLPVIMALLAIARHAAAALASDRSGMFWLRAGAASGLAGVGVQSLFEAGLLTPANGVLAAVAAAILVHAPGRYGAPAHGVVQRGTAPADMLPRNPRLIRPLPHEKT